MFIILGQRTEDLRDLEGDTQPGKLKATSVDVKTTPSTEISTPTVDSVNEDFYTADSAEETETNDTNVVGKETSEVSKEETNVDDNDTITENKELVADIIEDSTIVIAAEQEFSAVTGNFNLDQRN